MKIRQILLLLLLLTVLLPAAADAAPDEDLTSRLIDMMSLDEVNEYVARVNRELGEDIPRLDGDTLRGIAARGISLDWDNIRRTLLNRLFQELAANSHLMGKLLFLAVLCALLENLQNSFEHSAIALLAYSICYIFLAVIALTAFYNALNLARLTVGTMVGFMEALLPLLISLLAGVGAMVSAGLLTPLMLMVVTSVSLIVKDIVLPLLFLAAVLQCVDFFSDRYQVGNLAGLLRQAATGILGLTLVIFVGLITVQGIAGSVADGVALRTAKYATSTFVPVVGKMFADTVDLILGASLLLKNAVGLFGIVAVATICVFPLIKLVSLVLILKVGGALIQPMGDVRMARCLDAMGNNLLLVFGGVMAVALMFFLAITIVIGVGSAATMLR
ncbi:MAG: stage III sporulation protein AE [Negativicutes bacterium]|nr:stage III sporulation protein AE [Negativicutes bacterium]